MKLSTATLIFTVIGFQAGAGLNAANPSGIPADLDQVVVDAARYEPGASVQPLRRLEELMRQTTAVPSLRPVVESSLVRLLGTNSTYEAKRFACTQLGLVGTDTCLPALERLLVSEETAGIACLALSTHRSPQANVILRRALHAALLNARLQIIATLGNRRDTEVVGTLSNMVRHPDPAIVRASLIALGKIADPPARSTLAALRRDNTPAVAAAAALASLDAAGLLVAEKDKDRPARNEAYAIYEDLLGGAQPAYVRRAALAGLLPLEPDQGQQRITDVLRGTDAELKPVAIAAIRTMKTRSAAARFAAELKGLQASEQVLLLQAFGSRSDGAGQGALFASLGSAHAPVRAAAISGLSRQGGADAAAELLKALANSRTAEERPPLEQALVGLSGGKQADKALVALLRKSSDQEKLALVSILEKRGTEAAVPVLLKMAAEPAPAKVVFEALGSLASGDYADEMLRVLVGAGGASRADAEAATAQVLGKAAAVPAAALVLKTLAQASELELRCSLLRLLPSCADDKGLGELQAAANDPAARVREVALRTLLEWPDLKAWEVIAHVYAQPESDAQRVLALRALVRLAGEANAQVDAKQVDRYKQLLAGARNDQDRKLILSALSGAADPQALQLAVSLLSNAGVRAEAEIAVRKIAESIKAKHPQAAQEALQRLKN